jgi:hypothetical protein
MTKDHTPPETKANQTKRQTERKTSTPPEVENTRCYQMSLDKPQDMPRPLNDITRRFWTIKETHLKAGVETIQLRSSTWKMNTMMKQTWVSTKASRHKTSLSFGPRTYEQ